MQPYPIAQHPGDYNYSINQKLDTLKYIEWGRVDCLLDIIIKASIFLLFFVVAVTAICFVYRLIKRARYESDLSHDLNYEREMNICKVNALKEYNFQYDKTMTSVDRLVDAFIESSRNLQMDRQMYGAEEVYQLYLEKCARQLAHIINYEWKIEAKMGAKYTQIKPLLHEKIAELRKNDHI
jgi:hypothetical protein